MFLIGFFASILDSVAKSFFAYSLSIGPAGPILALDSFTSVLLTIFEAFRLAQIPDTTQTLGLGMGLLGALVLS